MWGRWRVLAVLLACVLCLSPSCGRPRPVEELAWTGHTGFSEWGETNDGFFGIFTPVGVLSTWTWNAGTLKRNADVQLPSTQDTIPLSEGRYLACVKVKSASKDEDWPLVLASCGSDTVVKKWAKPAGWCYAFVGISRNRQYAIVLARQDRALMDFPKDQFWPLSKVGLVDLRTLELRWVADLGEDFCIVPEGYIAVSDDGRFVYVAGNWDSGVRLLDTTLGRTLWSVRQVEVSYAQFSSDGRTIYTADESGSGLLAWETATGKVLRRWYTTKTGEKGAGDRVTCFALSPDDQWMAAGTRPGGLVYLFSTAPDGKPVVLQHRRGPCTIFIVSFSPDSKRLASVTPREIKTWEVPAGAGAAEEAKP